MKIKALKVVNVYGYLNFNLNFNNELNFIYGFNGSGKTSVLKIIMLTLDANFVKLYKKYKPTSIHLSLLDDDSNPHIIEFQIIKFKEDIIFNLIYTCNNKTSAAKIPSKIAEFAASAKDPENKPYLDHYLEMLIKDSKIGAPKAYLNICETINKLSKPMFLGLEDRLSPIIIHKDYHEDIVKDPNDLSQVFDLVKETWDLIRNEQEKLDKKFSESLLSLSADVQIENRHSLTSSELNEFITSYLGNFTELEEVKNNFKLKYLPENIKIKFEKFITNMKPFILKLKKLEQHISNNPDVGLLEFISTHKDTGSLNEAERAEIYDLQNTSLNLIVNASLIKHTHETLKLFEQYAKDRAALRSNLEKYQSLLNIFLASVKPQKIINIDLQGGIDYGVIIDGTFTKISLDAMSSGEKQLCIMLAHLTLNKKLMSGIFIVDEPELSLHLIWQKMFVDILQKANPDVQLIFATHSPSIIGDKRKYSIEV